MSVSTTSVSIDAPVAHTCSGCGSRPAPRWTCRRAPRPPPAAVLRHADVDGTYLIPAGWLHRAELDGGYPAGGGEPTRYGEPGTARLTLRCTSAAHGVDGLPNTVVRWPAARRAAKAYVLVAVDDEEPADDLLRLHLRRPPPTPGHQLVQVRLGAGEVIDVPRERR